MLVSLFQKNKNKNKKQTKNKKQKKTKKHNLFALCGRIDLPQREYKKHHKTLTKVWYPFYFFYKDTYTYTHIQKPFSQQNTLFLQFQATTINNTQYNIRFLKNKISLFNNIFCM